MKDDCFLEKYDSSKYEKVSVAVDLLVFTIEEEMLKLVTIRRAEPPFEGFLSLPGVFIGIGETLSDAVKRGIREETGLEHIYFEQLYTWGDINRDPRMRILSVSYMALVPIEKLKLKAGERVMEVKLYPVDKLLMSDVKLAFDHKTIISYARERLRNKVEYTEIAFELISEEFTLPQLQKIYEIILGRELYKANFRNRMAELIEPTDNMLTTTKHRPSRYYRRTNGQCH